MKQSYFLTIGLIATGIVFGNGVESEIKKVTVYQQGARIEREVSVNLQAGTNDITVTYLSPQLNQQSIEAGIEGNAAIISVIAGVNNLQSPKLSKRHKQLSDSLQQLNHQLLFVKSKKDGFEKQLAMLESNSRPGTNETAPTYNDLKLWVEYYGKKQAEIRNDLVQLGIHEQQLIELRRRIQNELNSIGGTIHQQVGEITCQVLAAKPTQIVLKLSYTVSTAGWYPVYDIRTEGDQSPIVIQAKANVYQNTNEEWNNVNLTLSTGNFVMSNNRPVLNPWYIDVRNEMPFQSRSYELKSAAETNTMLSMMDSEMAVDEDIPPQAIPVTMQQTVLSATYKIETTHTIPSNGQTHLVNLKAYELPAQYTYHAVPKLNESVFLLAKVTGYGAYNLLPGKTNIYYKGTYVGNTHLDPGQPIDTMLISLGKTQNITIQRKALPEFSDKKFIGGYLKETRGHEITLHNHLNIPVGVELLDQIPVSQNAQIQVEADKLDHAIFDATTGGVKWKVDLKPDETASRKIVFTVKYPKDKVISNF